jgi:16S rRNA (uracil1498-N3)-methyltransferase
MRLHRFIGEYNLESKYIEIKDKELINQIKNVLRLKEGDNFFLCDGKGKEALVKISEIKKKGMKVEIISLNPIARERQGKKLSLYLAILKKENFELAVQKAVEIGVSEIIPIITNRTIKTNLNFKRLEKIIKEASEQSGRTILPKLSPILKFEEALKDGKKNEEKIFYTLSLESDGVDLEDKDNDKIENNSSFVSIFVGPEGGFTKEENSLAKENNYKIMSLGKFTLRAETAAIVGIYKVLNN